MRRIALVVAMAIAACGGDSDDDAIPTVSVTSPVPDIDDVVDDLGALVDQLGCDHKAVFALTYRDTTAAIAEVVHNGGFADGAAIEAFDVAFARLYFDALDAWRADVASVSAAWRAAFEAADARAVNALGDELLAFNAHIAHDLVVALVEAEADDGDKRDFEVVNGIIGKEADAMVATLASTFDPTVSAAHVATLGLGADNLATIFMGWRETAWQEAQRILALPEDRRATALEQVDARVATSSLAIRAATSYLPVVQSSAERDAFCDTQR